MLCTFTYLQTEIRQKTNCEIATTYAATVQAKKLASYI
jgi:DNA polymerase III sliding clamp (beta) subunit (PCNA family)